MAKRISVALLNQHDACRVQVVRFEKFLAGRKYVLPTEENLKAAAAFGLDVRWAYENGIVDGCYEHTDGSKQWWVDGKRHREDGPAIECTDGFKQWWVDGKLHREDGPAIERADGYKEWWVNGKLHREDGPAVEHTNGTEEWWVDGKRIR